MPRLMHKACGQQGGQKWEWEWEWEWEWMWEWEEFLAWEMGGRMWRFLHLEVVGVDAAARRGARGVPQ